MFDLEEMYLYGEMIALFLFLCAQNKIVIVKLANVNELFPVRYRLLDLLHVSK